MEYEIYEKIAASIFGGDPGLLSASLGDELESVARHVRTAGGELRSRQVIATIIHNWEVRNPSDRPYHYGG